MTEVKTAGLIFICFLLLHGFVAALNCTSPTPASLADALEKELFPRKLQRPVNSFSNTLNVTISMIVVGIIGVNEKAQALTIFIWQVLEWDIQGFSWDEKECGTKRVSVLRENLWIPDVKISEFMDEDESPITPYVYLYNNGHVYDDKPMRVVSYCRLVIYTFPFDVQNCTLTFGSYLHFADDIRMLPTDTPLIDVDESKHVMHTRGEWELVDFTIASNNLDIIAGSYSEIKFFIILRRRPVLYVVNLLIPSCFLLTLDLFSFLLPPNSVDRSTFKMTLILGYTVFLLIMKDLLPVTGETTAPLINVHFSISLALMVASLLETIFITNIQYSSRQYGVPPHWLNVLVLRYLAVIVRYPPQKSNVITVSLQPDARAMNTSAISLRELQSISADTPPVKPPLEPALEELRKLRRDLMAIRLQVDKQVLGSRSSQEWQMIGTVIDRLLFGLYIMFVVVCFFTIGGLWIWA